jgi:polyisoprenoid-binding protein YceI
MSEWLRVDAKLDRIQDDVTELKIQVDKIDSRMDRFDAHITGDEKIINKLMPILDKFPTIVSIVEDYEFRRKLAEKRLTIIKKVGLISGVVLSVAGVLKLFFGIF